MMLRLLAGLLLCTIAWAGIPSFDSLLTAKSAKRVKEDGDVVVNSTWDGKDGQDFSFVNAVQVPARLAYTRAKLLEIPKYKEAQYKKLSSAIQKMHFDPKTGTVEVLGEKGGLRMHSWVKVSQIASEEIQIDVVRGDLRGLKTRIYLWENGGRTLLLGSGRLVGVKQKMPLLVRTLLAPVSEVAIGVATGNFRGYIEEEIRKIKGLTGSYAPQKNDIKND